MNLVSTKICELKKQLPFYFGEIEIHSINFLERGVEIIDKQGNTEIIPLNIFEKIFKISKQPD